ncbi:hypothetical protein [Kribbella sindirgiensis]|uniref:Bulb-type lectin domain-containing protein n=1 Tax=Kribbella sindirgiensis TaxID=1124744 RepID=A0A4V2M6B0_9ACTN|nr:hypothetical protein [Kribbella sindirgiensis]TCC43032.1 hypothetical protein E0H50_00645 [Kribbella sindirgiensis]
MVRRLVAGVLAVGALLGGAVLVGSAPAEAKTVAVSDTLLPGQKLMAGQYIRSKSGVFTLIMQPRGDAKLYQRGVKAPLWASGTWRPNSVLVMGTDGTLQVIYGRTKVWSMSIKSVGAKLVLPNDGKLAIYNTRGKANWNRHMVIGTLMPQSKIAAADAYWDEVIMYSVNRVYTLKFQPNGNLVLFRNGTTALWSTGVTKASEAYGWVGPNGDFATVNAFGDLTFFYETRRPGSVLQLRDDGHLVMVNGRTVVKTFH